MLANLSFKAYFKLNNTRLCETVLGSVENALKVNRTFARNSGINDDSGEQCYSKADRVTYRYYLGRLRLFQHNIRAVSTASPVSSTALLKLTLFSASFQSP